MSQDYSSIPADEITLNGHIQISTNPFEKEPLKTPRSSTYTSKKEDDEEKLLSNEEEEEESTVIQPTFMSASQTIKQPNSPSPPLNSWKPLVEDEDEDADFHPVIDFPLNQPKCFGLTIDQSSKLSPFYYNGMKVPIIMYRCFTYLDELEAFKEVGIFRLSSVKSEINQLEKSFNELGDLNFLSMNPKPNVHAITTLFKRWLRSNEKILNDEECNQLLQLTKIHSHDIRIREFNSILKSLPFANFQIIKCLFLYLDKVLNYSLENKNSIDSLAMLFSANITNDPSGKNVKILADLLIDRETYFKS
ncbi:hypothetical protein CANARDRAFT_21261 [[Candida] arabinofermentans NRRL YB-2248]|uniref:Rho-GAP domain-containing protein n=1 Tax=[Candida] arabinofermentans NRRL YB-2248 TaxID=983967 RepID=A0A1E4T6K0_9ASCO|nr:hypothetical protein CANARDRAFT_21261 [[Candida] arabinofermentans NRRL YB-2248]